MVNKLNDNNNENMSKLIEQIKKKKDPILGVREDNQTTLTRRLLQVLFNEQIQMSQAVKYELIQLDSNKANFDNNKFTKLSETCYSYADDLPLMLLHVLNDKILTQLIPYTTNVNLQNDQKQTQINGIIKIMRDLNAINKILLESRKELRFLKLNSILSGIQAKDIFQGHVDLLQKINISNVQHNDVQISRDFTKRWYCKKSKNNTYPCGHKNSLPCCKGPRYNGGRGRGSYRARGRGYQRYNNYNDRYDGRYNNNDKHDAKHNPKTKN